MSRPIRQIHGVVPQFFFVPDDDACVSDSVHAPPSGALRGGQVYRAVAWETERLAGTDTAGRGETAALPGRTRSVPNSPPLYWASGALSVACCHFHCKP